MNKKEKLYFIEKILDNYVRYNDEKNYDKQFKKSTEILLDFLSLNLIDSDFFNECKSLLWNAIYNSNYTYFEIVKMQEKLCKKFNIEIIY